MKMLKKIFKIIVILFSTIFISGAILTLLIFYCPANPFIEWKETIVTTAMKTMRHQYIAKIFLSDKEIKSIMDKNSIKEPIKNSNIEDIKVLIENNVPSFIESEEERNKKQEELNKVELIDIKDKNYEGYLLIVNDPSRIKVISTDKLGKQGMKLKDIVEKYNFLGGINAGGFIDKGGHGRGGTPTECIIQDYKIVYGKENRKYNIIGFNKDDVMVLGQYTLDDARKLNIRDAVGFEPFLIVNGVPTIKEGNGGWGIQPRTAIGQTKDGKVLMLVIDGRQLHSVGATLKDVQDIMMQYGAYNAANLDGGSSTVMYYDNKLINKPSSRYGERYLPSAFVIEKRDMYSNN